MRGYYFHRTFAIHFYFTASAIIQYVKGIEICRHTVSLLTDHMVFSPKYRGKVLVGDVAMLAEAIIRKTCKELDIKIIDMSVSGDNIHLFYSISAKVFRKFYC